MARLADTTRQEQITGETIVRIPSTIYQYGLPFGAGNSGSGSANLQFAFQESSGDIVDSVASVTCADTGTIDYAQTATGPYMNFKGAKFTDNGEYFDLDAEVPEASLGTGDFTIEWVQQLGITAQDSTVCYGYTGARHGFIQMLSSLPRTYFYFEATDGTTSAWQQDISSPFDGLIHKHRLKATGRGTAQALLTYYIDGVSQGTAGFTGQNGKTIPCGRLTFGWNQAVAYKHDGTLYEYRITPTGTANSGGPGGG